jgi:hypothetical protein
VGNCPCAKKILGQLPSPDYATGSYHYNLIADEEAIRFFLVIFFIVFLFLDMYE